MKAKYKILAQKIEKNIKKKSIGSFLPSESELLLEYKASRNTLRSALGMLRECGLIESKAGVGTKIISHSSKSKEQQIVRVILPSTGYQFFYEIMDGINSVLDSHQMILQYKNCNNDFATEQQYLKNAVSEDFDGLIYMSYFYADQIIFPSELNQQKNVVMVNNEVRGFDGPLVCSEDEKGAYEIVSHMIEMGHKKIIHLGGAKCSSHQSRKDGYIKAMDENDLELHVYPVGSDLEEAYQFIKKNYKKNRLAGYSYFCANDFSALGCCKGLEEIGIHIPNDVSVTGFGGLNDQIGRSSFSITTMKQDAFLLGQKAAEILVNLITNKDKERCFQKIQLPVHLSLKGSVAKHKI